MITGDFIPNRHKGGDDQGSGEASEPDPSEMF
jgi:hypothetical protein